jgi:ribosomal protein L37AE/L43A
MARAKKKLARLQRKLDRQTRANNPDCFDEKGRWIKGKRATVTSKRMVKTRSQIRALTGHVANQRKEAYHRIVDDLLKRYDTLYLGEWKGETPKVQRAKKKKRKEAFAKDGTTRKKGEAALEKLGNTMDRDNALGLFRQIAKEKVARSGGFKKLVLEPEQYTTQTCAKCQALTGPKGLAKQGWWTCSDCGHKQLRGRTAAWNILQNGLKAELECISEPAPEGAGEAPKKSPARGKGARQALKGRGNTAVGRMPSHDGEGVSAPRPARGTRKALTPVVSATGLPAPVRATSTVTSSGGRGSEHGASHTTESGKAERPTAWNALAGLRENQVP